jgi:hypothetical protein
MSIDLPCLVAIKENRNKMYERTQLPLLPAKVSKYFSENQGI